MSDNEPVYEVAKRFDPKTFGFVDDLVKVSPKQKHNKTVKNSAAPAKKKAVAKKKGK